MGANRVEGSTLSAMLILYKVCRSSLCRPLSMLLIEVLLRETLDASTAWVTL